jgi:uncharacterized protein involved in type VI secretion and phage assembly
MGSKWLLALILILPFAGISLGQNSVDGATPPLGDIAKKNKNAVKSKAKHVFTEDDMSVRSGPIPAIALQGADNTEEVLNAIHEFRRTHDAAETERVVHEWYDGQTEILSAAIEGNTRNAQHNQLKMEAAQDRYAYGNGYDGDYQKLQQRQLSERWSQRSDARSNQENFQTIARIQQAFARVRCDVIFNRGKTAYDWFRIRSANGVGSY